MLKSIHKSLINLGIASLGAATMLLSQASASLAQTSVFLQGSFNDGGQILPGSSITFNQFSNLSDSLTFQNIINWNINTTDGSSLNGYTYNPSSSSYSEFANFGNLNVSSVQIGDIHRTFNFGGISSGTVSEFDAQVTDIAYFDENGNSTTEPFDENGNPRNVESVLSLILNDRDRFGTVAFLGAPIIGESTQNNPIIPITNIDIGVPPVFEFINVPSGAWFDPPAASGYTYTITSNSLFSEILDFPTGFSAPFTVSANGVTLGTFSAGDSLVFPNGGVPSFSITGITPATDPNNPNAFPLQLAFNTPTASFTQTIISSANTRVPEPSAMVGLGFVFFVGALSRKLKTA